MSKAYFSRRLILRPEEEIELVARPHWLTMFWEGVIAVILILGSFFLMFPLFTLGEVGVSIFVALLVTGIIYACREFIKWYFNVFIITTQRIIDIDRRGFFHKTVSELPFEKVQDVSYSVAGIFQSIFKLGNIKVQSTGATKLALYLQNVPKPEKINQLLTDLIKELTGHQVKVTQVAEEKIAEPVEDNSQKISLEKAQATKEFLGSMNEDVEKQYQQDLEQYKDYNLDELVEEYKTTFSELELKKLLVDELEEVDKK